MSAAPTTTVASQATAALSYAKSHGGSGGRGLALIGFGWGGTQALLFAAGRTDVVACVAFYPDPVQTLKSLPKITAPTLAIFAGDDPATSGGVKQFEEAAAASRRAHTVKVFPGVTRGFHDPGETKIFKPDSAKEAWDTGDSASRLAHEREGARQRRLTYPYGDTPKRVLRIVEEVHMTALARGISVALLVAAWVGAVWVVSGTTVRAQDKKTVWDKVYTAEQATKGKVEYDTHCSGCHVKDLSGRDGGGEGPELAGAAFTKKWDFQNLNQLFSEIKTRMPRDQPASLSAEAYLNIVTYILQANKLPGRRRGADAGFHGPWRTSSSPGAPTR